MAKRDPQTGFVVDDSVPTSSEKVTLYAPDGTFADMPIDQAQIAVRDYGYQLDTPELRRELQLQSQYGEGMGNAFAAGGLGAARGLTFGLSDLALEKSGLVSSEALRELEARNPDASLTGELASFAIPALGAIKALGTAGRVARGVGAGLIGAGKVAHGIESGAGFVGGALSRGLGLRSGGVVSDVMSSLAPRALGMSAEAELYQLGHNLSQAVMRDEDLTAETLLAHSENALMMGGGLGLVSPLAARLGRAAVDRVAPEIVKSAAAKIAKGANAAMKKVAEFFDPDNSLQLFSGLKSNTPERFPQSVRGLRDAGFYRPGEVKFDPASMSFKQVAKGGLPDREAAVARLMQGKKDVGAAMDALLSAGDGVTLGQNIQRFGLKDEKRMADLIGKMRSNGVITEGEASRLDSIVKDRAKLVADKAGNLKGLHQLRQGLDEALAWDNAKALLKPEKQVLKELRQIVNEKIAEGANELAEKGLIKGGDWKKLNRLYMNLSDIEKPIRKSIQQAKAWVNVAGLRWRDLQLAATGAPIGASIGGLIGDDEGAMIGGMIGGGLGIANKLFQTERGLLWRAQIGERLGSLAAANNAIVNVGQRIAGAASRFAKTPAAAATISATKVRAPARLEMALTDEREHRQELAAAKDPRSRYRVMMNKLSSLNADPGRTAESIGAALRGADHLSPGIRDKLITKQLQAYAFLASVAPQDPLSGYLVNPAQSSYQPSDGEIRQWERYVRAAQSPLSVLDDLQNNQVTPEAAETIKVLYPRLFMEIQGEILAKVASAKEPLRYEDRAQMGLLFDVPTDPSLAPEFAESLLARFDEQPSGPESAETGAVARTSGADKLSIENDLTRTEVLAQ